MAKKAESRLQLNIRKTLVKEVGGKWWKVHGSAFQEAGKPDLDGAVKGDYGAIPFKFEVKVPLEGKPSELQLQELHDWRALGVIACIVESSSQAVALVKAAQAAPGSWGRGRRCYRWICSTLRSTHGEDMGYGRSPRGRVGHNRRRSARWAINQLEKYLGEVPEGTPTPILGVP